MQLPKPADDLTKVSDAGLMWRLVDGAREYLIDIVYTTSAGARIPNGEFTVPFNSLNLRDLDLPSVPHGTKVELYVAAVDADYAVGDWACYDITQFASEAFPNVSIVIDFPQELLPERQTDTYVPIHTNENREESILGDEENWNEEIDLTNYANDRGVIPPPINWLYWMNKTRTVVLVLLILMLLIYFLSK